MPSTPRKSQKDTQKASNNKDRTAAGPGKQAVNQHQAAKNDQSPASKSRKSATTVPSPGVTKSPSGLHYLLNAWIFIPAVFYFMLVGQYTVNAPIKDDYDAILGFLYNFSQSHGVLTKIGLLFSQHNEHRILSTRLLTALYYELTGKVSFRTLIFVGNLQLIVIFLVSVHFIRRWLPKYWNFVAFVWGLCIFDPSSYENGAVTMTSLQNFGIVMLFLVSLYFYSVEKRNWLVPAVIFQFLCIFSSGNGIPGAALVAIFTLFSKDKWKMVTSFIVLIVFAPLYFYHYVTPVPPPGPKPVISVAAAIPYFFKMTGAHFSFTGLSLFYGILVVAVLLICLPYRKKIFFERDSLPIVFLLAFIIVTEGLVALIRSSTQIFYASRYLIYPHLFAAIAFLFLFRKLMDRKILWSVVIVFCGMVYAYSNNYKYGQSGFEREGLRAEAMDYYYPDKAKAKIIATNACQAGIYCLQDDK